MRGKRHADTTRAKVTAALLTGEPVTTIAGTYHLHESTVRNWKRQIRNGELTKVNAKKGNGQIETLVLANLAASLASLTAQAVALTDPVYIGTQPPVALALLHGTMADRALRLLSFLPRDSVPTCPN